MKNQIANKIIREEMHVQNGICYSYKLTLREGRSMADFRIPLYSIGVEMTDTHGRTTRSEAKDIFDNCERAIAFFEKLTRNLATPIDLNYIVEDELI